MVFTISTPHTHTSTSIMLESSLQNQILDPVPACPRVLHDYHAFLAATTHFLRVVEFKQERFRWDGQSPVLNGLWLMQALWASRRPVCFLFLFFFFFSNWDFFCYFILRSCKSFLKCTFFLHWIFLFFTLRSLFIMHILHLILLIKRGS